MTRRTLLSGLATGLGVAAAAVPAPAGSAPEIPQAPSLGAIPLDYRTNLSVPFGATGTIGEGPNYARYVDRLLTSAVVPPVSSVSIFAHGWLTDASELMLIYDIIVADVNAQARAYRSDPVQGLAPATGFLAITTHWPSRPTDNTDSLRSVLAPASFSRMEARANLVGATGMARLIGIVRARLLALPQMAATRLNLVGHSFGCRVLCSALQILAQEARPEFTALQARNPINLVLLEPALPFDALDPNTLTQAYPFA